MAGKLAVIGAGLMGSGIAQVSAQAGWDVVLRDVTDEALNRGLDGIRASYDRFVSKGRLEAADADAALARITATTDLDAAADADIVVEAVFEKLEVKHEIFQALDKIVRSTSQRQSNFLPPQSGRPADTSKTPHKSNKKKWILIALALGGAAVTAAVVLQKDETVEMQTITAGTLTIGQPQ